MEDGLTGRKKEGVRVGGWVEAASEILWLEP